LNIKTQLNLRFKCFFFSFISFIKIYCNNSLIIKKQQIFTLHIQNKFIIAEKEILIQAFRSAEKPLKTAELVEITGLDKYIVLKTLKKYKEEGLIDSQKRCYYALK